jgi:hypothetical protein
VNIKSVGYKRRQYEDVARLLGEAQARRSESPEVLAELENLTFQFVRLFAEDNHRFERARFELRVKEWKEGKRG